MNAPAEAPPGARTLFFVHIPKCAGTSIRNVLRRWYGPGLVMLNSYVPQALAEATAALGRTPEAVAGHFRYGMHEAIACTPLYVSMTRDPVDRFVSLYKHVRASPEHVLHAGAAGGSLEAFYAYCLEHKRARNHTLGIQCFFLSRTRRFEEARAVIDEAFDLIAPVEDAAAFVRELAALLGKPEVQTPALNVREEDAALRAEAEALAGRIREDHVEDLRLHRYVKERFARRRTGDQPPTAPQSGSRPQGG